jgi:hypothetical protein
MSLHQAILSNHLNNLKTINYEKSMVDDMSLNRLYLLPIISKKKRLVMQKEFIPYEQALNLKELGFDEPCFGYYNTTWSKQNELLFPQYAGELENWNEMTHLCSAPLYQQAFRWFRGKFKIISTIHFYCDGDKWEDVVYEVRISEFEYFKTHDSFVQSEFKTYEEAELACLKKLIEIVKEKEN